MTAPQLHNDSDLVSSKAVLALALVAFASSMSQRATDALLPRLASDFEVTLGTASWAISCFTIGYALCQLFFGPVGDRYGKYLVIALASTASCMTALLCALAPNLSLLLAARMFAGGMTAGVIPLSMAWIGDVVPYEQRQPMLARFLIGSIIGVSVSQFLGGLSADYLGWRVPFFVIAILFMIGALMLFSVRRNLPPHALATQPTNSHPVKHMVNEFSLVFAQPWARVVLVTVFLEGACVFGSLAFFASHLHQTLNISLTTAGTLVMLFGFGGFLFATTSRRLVLRLAEIGLARWGAGIMAASLIVMAITPSEWIAAPACFTMGLGFYMFHNTLQTNATQMAPERRGAAVSAFAFAFFVGQSCGVAIAGWMVGHFGTSAVLCVSAVGVVLVAGHFARQKRIQLQAVSTQA